MLRIIACVLLALFLTPLLGGSAVGATELRLAVPAGALVGLLWNLTGRRTTPA